MKPMIIPYNEKTFTPEEVKAGMVVEFIDFLIKQDIKSAEVNERGSAGSYTNINITNGGGDCVIVQWCEVLFNDDSPKFEFVNYDEHIGTVLELPDNSTVLCWDEDDAKETLDNFLKEHPYYKKNEYGHWYNENEQKEWENFIKKTQKAGDIEDDLSIFHIGDHTDHTEDGYDGPFKSLEKYRDCADCPQENGAKITCDECGKFNTSSTAAIEDYDLVVCTAKEDTNCDNDCDNCNFNSSNQPKED